MKIFLLAALAATAVFADPLIVFNTGVNNSNFVLPVTSTDPHYTAPGPTFVLSQIPGVWLANDSVSEWIGPDTIDGSTLTGGVYSLIYRMTVDLTGFDPSTAVLTGRWSTDNAGTDIKVNGTTSGSTSSGYSAWTPFSLTNGFVAGINNIDFAWSNAGGQGGLRVEWTSATANSIPSAIPEPGSVILLLTGAAALAGFKRFRS